MNKIEDRNSRLSLIESRYWKRFFMNNLKIGVELECCYNSGICDSPIEVLRRELEPSRSYGNFGKCGVVNVDGDGSLSNGAEIKTIGRRLDFIDLYFQYKHITRVMMSHGAIMNARAGLHNHIMLDYGATWSCLEKNVPEVIMKNYIQLLKNFAPELVWITSTVNQGESITRKRDFCNHDTLMMCHVSGNTLSRVIRQLTESNCQRYKFINMLPMELNNGIKKFHFELRFPDGSIYPAQIAAQNMMYAALMLKAIKLSEAGVIALDNEMQTTSLIDALRTRDYRDRCSAPIPEATETVLIQRSLAMIEFIKPELDNFDIHIFPILKILAMSPISKMRRQMSDEDVNNSFHTLITGMYEENLESVEDVIEYITLQNNRGCRNEDAWKEVACTDLSISKTELESKMTVVTRNVEVKFDRTLGTYVIV